MPIGREHADIAADKCEKLVRTDNVSLFLAHYDGSRDDYARRPWYARVEFTAVAPAGIKIVLARRLLIEDETMRATLLSRFSHVWVTDDDVAFPGMRELRRFLTTAASLDAAIVQPTTDSSVHGLVRPRQGCAVATPTDFVEFQSPLMERCVFLETVGVLHHSTRSDYGLDMVWCRYVASRAHSRWDLCTACAVIEARGFEKRYGTTHAHSYNVSAAMEDDQQLRQAHAPYESLCTVVGACRDGAAPLARSSTPAARVASASHRRFPYRRGTCTAPRAGLVISGQFLVALANCFCFQA